MADTVLVTGGTGTLGRHVVEALVARGARPVVLSRRQRRAGDPAVGWAVGRLATGEGVPAALQGVDAVVHCATNGRRRTERVLAQRLADGAARAGVSHLVYVSIVGVDRVPLPYYRGKLEAEQVIERAAVPSTILRATQFHDLIRGLLDGQRLSPVLVIPKGFRFQPVAEAEVGARLAEVALGRPVGRATDFGGPEVRPLDDLAESLLRARDRQRRIVRVPVPGRIAAAYRAGWHLAPDHAAGTQTFEQYLGVS